MTVVFLVGESADEGLEILVKTNLTNTYKVTCIKENSVSSFGKGYDILVMDSPFISSLELGECIIVMKAFGKIPNVTLPEKSIVIANSENAEQMSYLEMHNKHFRNVITCGNNKCDTFSYTSLTRDRIVISLNRELTAFSAKKIQPLEIPVKFSSPIDNIYDTIAYTALRLVLDDYDSEIGLLY